MIEILETREDGTFVILHDGLPFHCTPEYCPDLYAEVQAQVAAQTEGAE